MNRREYSKGSLLLGLATFAGYNSPAGNEIIQEKHFDDDIMIYGFHD